MLGGRSDVNVRMSMFRKSKIYVAEAVYAFLYVVLMYLMYILQYYMES